MLVHHVSWYNAMIFATNWNRNSISPGPGFFHIFSNPKPEVQNQIHWIAHAAKLHLSREATNVPGKYFLEDWLSECVVEFKAKKCTVDVLWCFTIFVGWFAFTTQLHHDFFTVVWCWFCTMINLCKPLCFTNPWPLCTYDDQLGCQAPVWMPMRMAKAGKPNFWNSSFKGPKAWTIRERFVSFQWGICFLPSKKWIKMYCLCMITRLQSILVWIHPTHSLLVWAIGSTAFFEKIKKQKKKQGAAPVVETAPPHRPSLGDLIHPGNCDRIQHCCLTIHKSCGVLNVLKMIEHDGTQYNT